MICSRYASLEVCNNVIILFMDFKMLYKTFYNLFIILYIARITAKLLLIITPLYMHSAWFLEAAQV